MSNRVGTACIYHTRRPHQRKMERMAENPDLSEDAGDQSPGYLIPVEFLESWNGGSKDREQVSTM